MTDTLHTNNTTSDSQAESHKVSARERIYPEFSRDDWKWPLIFMLCMSMNGLKFPFGYLFVPLVLIARFRKNRYDFLIMLTMFLGGYGLIDLSSTWKYSLSYVVMALGFAGLMLLRKPPFLKKAITVWGIYAAGLFLIAMTSEEKLSIQFRSYFHYIAMIYFLVPLMVFSGRRFDIREFYRKVIPYAVIMSCFYIIDAYIFCGNILLPTTYIGEHTSTFWSPYIRFLSMHPLRKYPIGIYWVAMIIIPTIYYYKLRPWQWIVVIVGVIATQTFTVISGFVVAWMIFLGKAKTLAKYAVAGIILAPIIYNIDSNLPIDYTNPDYPQSTLRIKSTIDQLTSLQAAEDDEDLSRAGSGRIGQVIPKFELLYSLDREWLGLGFLDRNRTTNPKYLLYNEYYEDVNERWEVATRIEISPLQVIITVGYLGLILQVWFFWAMWRIARRLKYINYYLSILFIFFWFGIGDFGGLIRVESLILVGLAYGVMILANRKQLGFADPDYDERLGDLPPAEPSTPSLPDETSR